MLLLLLLLLMVMWLWRCRVCVMLLMGIVCVPRGIPFVVGMVRSSHAVQHGLTAEILMMVVDHCSRHLGDSAANRQSVFGLCVSVDPVRLVCGNWQLVTLAEVGNHTEEVTRRTELLVVPNRHKRLSIRIAGTLRLAVVALSHSEGNRHTASSVTSPVESFGR